jgi:alpha-tubulin suppressor-like RCC1 family protein
MKKYILLYTILLYTISTNAQCWESIANGIEQHVMAIQTNGTLWGWGINAFGSLENETTISH